MTQIPIVRQILSDPDTGLLSYLSQQLQTPSFSHFKSQFGFYVDESCTQVTSVNDSLEIQTILLLTLKLSIIADSQTPSDEAAVHAVEFQELLDAQIISRVSASQTLLTRGFVWIRNCTVRSLLIER